MTSEAFFSHIRSSSEFLSPQIIQRRRALHAMPELQMDTVKTETYIASALNEIGIKDVQFGVGGHGVVALIRGSNPGKCLAIRADCDALPIQEETGLP